MALSNAFGDSPGPPFDAGEREVEVQQEHETGSGHLTERSAPAEAPGSASELTRHLWSPAEIVACVERFYELYGRPPDLVDWNPTAARRRGRPQAVERYYRDACWPHAGTVRQVFGSWRKALVAAGFPDPPPRGGARARERWLADGLVSAADIAELAGIDRFGARKPLLRSDMEVVEVRGKVPLYRRSDGEEFACRLRAEFLRRAEAREARERLAEDGTAPG